MTKQQTKEEEKVESNAWGIASLVCGILSILLILMPYFGLPLAVMAIVFSGIQKKNYSTNGTATGGLVTGIIGMCLNLVVGMLVVLVLSLGI